MFFISQFCAAAIPGRGREVGGRMVKPSIKPLFSNSITPMMTPSHLKAPQKSPITLELIKKATATPKQAQILLLKPRNGIGHFVLPLQRILFTYCSHCGDSNTTKYATYSPTSFIQ